MDVEYRLERQTRYKAYNCYRLTCSNALRALLLTFLTDLPGDVTDCLLGACSEASGGQSGRIKARGEARSEASIAGLNAKL